MILDFSSSQNRFGVSTGGATGVYQFDIRLEETDVYGNKTGSRLYQETIMLAYNQHLPESIKDTFGIHFTPNSIGYLWNFVKNPFVVAEIEHQIEIVPYYSVDGVVWSNAGELVIIPKNT